MRDARGGWRGHNRRGCDLIDGLNVADEMTGKMQDSDSKSGNPPPTYGRLPKPRKTVSRVWAVATVVLAILLVVVVALPFVLTLRSG